MTDDLRPPITTTDTGIPAASDDHSLTVGPNGPTVLHDASLYRDVMTDQDREHLAGNIIAHASAGVSTDVQKRVIDYWTQVDPGLGARVAAGLGRPDAELAVPPTLG